MKLNKYSMKHRFTTGTRVGMMGVSLMQDVTPGEIWYGKTTSVVRMDPLNKPAFLNLNIHRRKFFVPYRILDDGFVDGWTGRQNPYVPPQLNLGTNGPGASAIEFLKIFGLVPNFSRADQFVTNFPMMAYNLIWNKFYRPEGVSEVSLTANISPLRVSHPNSSYHGAMRDSVQLGDEVTITVMPGDTVSATGIRDGMALQRLRENQYLYGDKYTDRLRMFGVNVSSGLVDEPVPISSARSTMGISEVVETANTGSEGGMPGQMAGHGITIFQDTLKPRKFNEPGILMEVYFARPPLTLKNRIDRSLFMKGNENEGCQFYNPETALQSDAVVSSDEIEATGAAETNFAYCDNFDWLRKPTNTIAGQMVTDSYKEFTDFKDITTVPTLDFLQQVDDYDYLFQNGASSTRADIQLMCQHNLKKYSPVRKRGRS